MEFVWHVLSAALERIFSGDEQLLATAWRTLRFALLATGAALLVGLPLALWVSAKRTRPRRIALVLANTGLGLPPVVLGVYLALVLLPGSALGSLNWTYTWQAVVLAQALLALPVVVALAGAALLNLPSGLLEQARAFGASPWRRAALALREARIGLLAAVVATLGSALAEVGAVVIVGGNIRGRTSTLASTVLLDLGAGDDAAALANVLVLLALLALLALLLTIAQQRDGRWRPTLPALRWSRW